MTYQYSNFGVPGLGLRRGLGDDVVVAPYATALAAMFDAEGVRSATSGRSTPRAPTAGTDSTSRSTTRPTRLPEGKSREVVRMYMAHHQGMTIVAIAERAARRRHAHALPCGADGAGQRAAAAGAHAARRGASRRPRADAAAVRGDVRELVSPHTRHFSSPHSRDAAHAAPLQRALRRDDHRRRLRLQPLARPGGHAVARGRDERRHRARTSSCATSRAASAGRPASSPAARRRRATTCPSPRIAPSSSGATARSRRASR